MRQLPNLLGLFRIIATPVLAWWILLATPTAYLGAALLLLLMALSDMADGRLARHLKVVSPLGIFIDTISDKIFVAGVLIPMVEVGLLPAWVALAIIIREFVVSGLRSFAAAEGVVISARRFGKQKLVITVVALIWRLLAAHAETGGFLGQIAGGLLIPLLNLWFIPMALALIWTIGSGIEYLWQAWPLLRRSWSPGPSGQSGS
ncbi:CDP-diacylglycerol--glycerol-3-phosphate 3-phosphatidyltransferase [Chloroflexus sp.]|uniref:CDP-diacylglycerol--glycerol-3-phosphate 3-phosphatidyltransferase n=1 Tax=Chloroflexus sp. TaxID=1904827 RepID=UPI0026200337|nr:CDP-diacylglycerol--glycerol-3-phosphate 3-phosphatidyltransferase [uncultured Chloroflexus sp.]